MKSSTLLLAVAAGCTHEPVLVFDQGIPPLVSPELLQVSAVPGCHTLKLHLSHSQPVADVTWLGVPAGSVQMPRIDSLQSPTGATLYGTACHEGMLQGQLVVADTAGRAQAVPVVLAADTGVL